MFSKKKEILPALGIKERRKGMLSWKGNEGKKQLLHPEPDLSLLYDLGTLQSSIPGEDSPKSV